jgi:hypothetical protein
MVWVLINKVEVPSRVLKTWGVRHDHLGEWFLQVCPNMWEKLQRFNDFLSFLWYKPRGHELIPVHNHSLDHLSSINVKM